MTVARRLGLAALAGGLLGSPAWALSGVIAAPAETRTVAAFSQAPVGAPQQPLPVGTAAFPDVEPPVPSPLPDPLLSLLGDDPYKADLAAAIRAETEGNEDVSPYAELIREYKVSDAPLDNPYIDELRLMTSEGAETDNPYAAARRH